MAKEEYILVANTGNLVQLLLSVPVFKTIKKNFPQKKLLVLVNEEYLHILDNEGYIDKFIGVQVKEFSEETLIPFLDKFNIKQALLLKYDTRIVKALKRTGTSQIIGMASNLFSFIKLSSWKKQFRDRAHKHEVEYNLDLLSLLGIEEIFFDNSITVSVSGLAKTKVEEMFELKDKPYVVMAPVSEDNFLNIRYSYYAELILRITEDLGVDVFLISSNRQEDIEIVNMLHRQTHHNAHNLAGILDSKLLPAFISGARLFIGPHSGYLHLAAALNVPNISFYPKLKVNSAVRWKPYSNFSKVFVSNIKCKEKKCIDTKCKNYFCMDSININSVFKEIGNLFYRAERPNTLGF